MLFSIIIPTFKRPELLVQCLSCLLPQTQSYKEPYEIIVTDDSPDNDIQQIIKAQFPFVKWVEGPKKGPASNRNYGASQATGEWLVFTDDDCLPDKDWLQSISAQITPGKEVDVIEGKTVADREKRRLDEVSPINLTGGNLWSCNFAIRKSAFENLSGFDETFKYAAGEDMDLYNRIVKNNYKVVFDEHVLVTHPWRQSKPFRNFLRSYVSYKQYILKTRNNNKWQYRKSRIKIFLHRTFTNFLSLCRFKGKGSLFYIETVVNDLLLIFI